MEKYAQHIIQQAQASGATAAEVNGKIKDIQSMKSMYGSFLGVILVTYLEILPVGLIVSLLTALILKRNVKQGNVAIAP